MRFCTGCGRARNEGARFCTGCGKPYPDAGPPAPAPSTRPSRLAAPPGRRVWLGVFALAVVGGAAVAGVLLSSGHAPGRSRPDAAGGSARPSSGGSAASETKPTPPASPAITPSTSSPSTGPASSDSVSMAPGVAAQPGAPQVVSLLNSYFTAINAHDYQGYFSLFTLQAQQGLALTQEKFSKQFGTTADSDETLTGISPADGATVAAVTFTSHQDPADSANGQPCTAWHILLSLQQNGIGYLCRRILNTDPGVATEF